MCVFVVDSNSIRVTTWLRHDGQVTIVGSGPTFGDITTVTVFFFFHLGNIKKDTTNVITGSYFHNHSTTMCNFTLKFCCTGPISDSYLHAYRASIRHSVDTCSVSYRWPPTTQNTLARDSSAFTSVVHSRNSTSKFVWLAVLCFWNTRTARIVCAPVVNRRTDTIVTK